MDPVSVAHVLKNSTVYEKPWQSRRLITGLIGCGLLAAEGQMHKRQRRVVTPAFSIQNMRALVPLVFRKGEELRDKWMEMIEAQNKAQKEDVNGTSMVLDVCHWISRATFDVIGLAGELLPFVCYICYIEYVPFQDSTINSTRYKTNRTSSSVRTRICLR